jgi:hypothetical protein
MQLFFFSSLTTKLGVLPMLRLCLVILPILYFLVPFTVLFEPAWLRQTLLLCLWMIKNVAAIFAFPCNTILITNSAKSLRHLGTVNGITTSLGAIGRAAGPTLVGAAFTYGVHHALLIVPFWIMTGIAMLSWIPLFMAKEGPGFGDDPPEEKAEDEHDLEDLLSDADVLADDESESRKNGLKHRKRRSVSIRVSTDKDKKAKMLEDVVVMSDSEGEGEGDDGSQWLLKPEDKGRFPTTRLGRPGHTGKGSVARHRSATPIGAGEGFRRLSSNLGVSNSGFGSGSEL